jgi:hypothetical protein
LSKESSRVAILVAFRNRYVENRALPVAGTARPDTGHRSDVAERSVTCGSSSVRGTITAMREKTPVT